MTGVLIPYNVRRDSPSDLSLLPENMTQLELDLSLAMERLSTVPIDISVLWNADTCPLDLLPFLAWTVSVDYWNADWPEDMKRRVVKASLQLHFKKGTRPAVERVLALLGCDDGTLVEWWQNDPLPGFENPMRKRTFKLVLPEGHPALTSQARQEVLRDMVATVKPLTAWWHVQIDATGEIPVQEGADWFGVLKDFTPSVYSDKMSAIDAMHTLIYGLIAEKKYCHPIGTGVMREGVGVFVTNTPRRRPVGYSSVVVARLKVEAAVVDTVKGTVSFNDTLPVSEGVGLGGLLAERRTNQPMSMGFTMRGTTSGMTGSISDRLGSTEVGLIPGIFAPVLASNVKPFIQPELVVRIASLKVPTGFMIQFGKVIDPSMAITARAGMYPFLRVRDVGRPTMAASGTVNFIARGGVFARLRET